MKRASPASRACEAAPASAATLIPASADAGRDIVSSESFESGTAITADSIPVIIDRKNAAQCSVVASESERQGIRDRMGNGVPQRDFCIRRADQMRNSSHCVYMILRQ